MFCKSDNDGYREMIPGIELKTLVHGENTLMAEYRLKKGSRLPAHRHPHEQTGYMVSGRMRLTIGEETREIGAGDSWNIPGDENHYAEILEDSIAVEVFYPVRVDFLPKNEL